MSDNFEDLQEKSGGGAREELERREISPTLYIGVGGTGMEVMMRLRRRILNNLWGGRNGKTRIESLTQFPAAAFLHFDLDAGAVIDSGKAQANDLQYELVKFQDDERLVERFHIEQYSRDEDTLSKYPHIKEWLPLTPAKIQELKIDPSKGAGQIRALSRLYFYDKYPGLRDKLRAKLKTLKACLSHEEDLKRLGLAMESKKFRIVVIGSIAGGTGSGSFLDMGWLARWLGTTENIDASVELMLFTPSGYVTHNKERVQGNGYAALMELETAMMGNPGYVGRWGDNEPLRSDISREPYNEIYLFDTHNMAGADTKDIKDVYHMVADSLFEDFASSDFGRRKRSVAVNQAQHKNHPIKALVSERFGDMRLEFSMRYSALGQAVLDTRQELVQDKHAQEVSSRMLKAFFGVGSADAIANRATDKQRDDFISKQMGVSPIVFEEFPEFSEKSVFLQKSSGSFREYSVVETLLNDGHGRINDNIALRVNNEIDEIKNGHSYKEWAGHVRAALKKLEVDAVRDLNTQADVIEDRVKNRRKALEDEVKRKIRECLYGYLDNKEYGGLEFVISLAEQVKARLTANEPNLVGELKINAERYVEIRDAVRTREFERLVSNLEQTSRGWFSGGEKQAISVLDHLRLEIANVITFHVRAKAAEEAADLMREISRWMGERVSVDDDGKVRWSGLIGELQDGRDNVIALLQRLDKSSEILRKELEEEHVTLIHIDSVEAIAQRDPTALQIREWADEAFQDIGGSKAIFPRLGDVNECNLILQKVRSMADRKIAMLSIEDEKSQDEQVDPLLVALEAMTPAMRKDHFRRLLTRAMPWVDLNMARDYRPSADQVRCYLGVSDERKFAKYEAELREAVASGSMASDRVALVTTGIPGRMVCYTELFGFPLFALTHINTWHTSYLTESKRTPIHTHIDITQFTHPIAPQPQLLNERADEFKIFLQAVMLGVLTRYERRFTPAGQYQVMVARGDLRKIGNEKALRLNGLPSEYKAQIAGRVEEIKDTVDANFLLAMSELAEYYARSVYTPPLKNDESGTESEQKGFSHTIAKELSVELLNLARRRGLTSEAEKNKDRLSDFNTDVIEHWTVEIPESDADPFNWEIRALDEMDRPRLKRRIKPEWVSNSGAGLSDFVRATLQPSQAVAMQQASPAGFAPMPPAAALPPSMAVPPTIVPPPMQSVRYHVGYNSQPMGEFDVQQIKQMLDSGYQPASIKVWRAGLADWMPLLAVPELAALIAAPGNIPPPLT